MNLLEEYKINPRKFMAKYRAGVVTTKPETALRTKPYVDCVLSLLAEYGKTDISYFSECVYRKLNNITTIPTCAMCSNDVMFVRDKHSSWCSATCTRKDSRKVPKHKQKTTLEKMHNKVKEILNDPEQSAQYKAKLSKASSEYMNVPSVRKAYSDRMRHHIQTGVITPCITNTWTRKTTCIQGKKFRSTFEGIFYTRRVLEMHEPIEYETLRIKYVNPDGIEKTYIVDFVDHTSKVAYEIKPKSLVDSESNSLKRNALLEWCNLNSYTYKEITEEHIFEYAKLINIEPEFVNEFKRIYRIV